MVIAHLYYDLLNLYGNDGNIKILEKKLNEIGAKVQIEYCTIGDIIAFDKYDLIYIGSGTENNLNLVLSDFMKYKEEVKKAIENNKLFLATGNSIDLFGKEITGKINREGLNVFNYSSIYVDRIKKDSVYNADFLKNPVLGYENHNFILKDNKNYLWENEGVKYKNFFGTYLEGPILVRNPEFLEFIISKLVMDKDKTKKLNLDLEYKAYENFKEMLMSDKDKK